MASIKPIDTDLIVSSTQNTGCDVTAENATVNGGFGSAVCEVLSESNAVPVRRIGVKDRFVESGGIAELFEQHGMRPEDIADAARQAIADRDAQKVTKR
jgi:transketolase